MRLVEDKKATQLN